jgi:hypothetical protein
MELIHGLAIAEQQGMALQCLHGYISLEKVIVVNISLFQRGVAPSMQSSTMQAASGGIPSKFIPQYAIGCLSFGTTLPILASFFPYALSG